jgi:hypothetical protein
MVLHHCSVKRVSPAQACRCWLWLLKIYLSRRSGARETVVDGFAEIALFVQVA